MKALAMAFCVLLSARSSSFLAAQATQAPTNATNATLPRLPGGHPNLQGLWLKSAGGFQGLFIGSQITFNQIGFMGPSFS